jgi:hypothetical protein
VLYFDQIEHDRFGTIRQQIWAILHFPLHVAILLTVEGSTTLILWNIIRENFVWLWTYYPDVNGELGPYFNSTAEVVGYINNFITAFEARFKANDLKSTYDYQASITAIKDIKAPFGSQTFNDSAGQIITTLWNGLDTFVFENFGIQGQENIGNESLEDKEQAEFAVFDTVFNYFYIASGVLLIALAVMYWSGKTHKLKGEYVSIAIRAIVGAGLTLACLSDWYGPINAQFGFLFSAWHIPIVTVSYFIGTLLLHCENLHIAFNAKRFI